MKKISYFSFTNYYSITSAIYPTRAKKNDMINLNQGFKV